MGTKDFQKEIKEVDANILEDPSTKQAGLLLAALESQQPGCYC